MVPEDNWSVPYVYAGIIDYEITFDFDSDEDIKASFYDSVTETERELVLDVDFNVTASGTKNYFTPIVALGTAGVILIYREIEYLQPVDFASAFSLNKPALEKALDRLTWMIQQVKGLFGRAVISHAGEDQIFMPTADTRRGMFLYGEDTPEAEIVGMAGITDVGVSAAMAPIVQSLSLSLARAEFDVLASGDIHNVPAGGATEDILRKNSASDYDVSWSAETLRIIIKNYVTGGEVAIVDDENLSVAPGFCANSVNDGYINWSVALSIDNTASGAGGLDTGSIAASTRYYIHIIYNPTTADVAALISLSATAPTLPSGYTKFRTYADVSTNATSDFLPASIRYTHKGYTNTIWTGVEVSGTHNLITGFQFSDYDTLRFTSIYNTNILSTTDMTLSDFQDCNGVIHDAVAIGTGVSYLVYIRYISDTSFSVTYAANQKAIKVEGIKS
jgi:hypothetical protein